MTRDYIRIVSPWKKVMHDDILLLLCINFIMLALIFSHGSLFPSLWLFMLKHLLFIAYGYVIIK